MSSLERWARWAAPYAAGLLVALVCVKLYKVVFAMWPLAETDILGWTRPSVAVAATRIVTSQLFGLLVVALISAWAWRRWPRVRVRAATALAVLVTLAIAAKLFLAWRSGVPWSAAFQSYFFAQAADQAGFLAGMLSTDIRSALVMWLLASGFGAAMGERHVRASGAVLLGLLLVLLVVVGVELAHYLKTGIGGSGELLIYFVRHASDLWFILRSEVDEKLAVAVIVPVAIGLATWALMVGRRPRDAGRAASARLAPAGRSMVYASLALGMVSAVPATLEFQYLRLKDNALATLAHDFVVARGRPAAADAPPLSTGQARAVAVRAPARPQNVVIVLMESVRAASTSIHRPGLGTTPFLEDLARRSLVVDDMQVVVPRTSAAWIATLQGVHPGTNTMLMNWGPRSGGSPVRLTSLPRLLRPHGYRSAFFVPTMLEHENEGALLGGMGFDKVVGVRDLDSSRFERVNYFGLEDRALLDPIGQWIDSARQDDRPFLLVAMTNTSHHPYGVPRHWPRRTYLASAQAAHARYLDTVAYTDDFVRRLFEQLQARKLHESTIFVVMGDHGEAFGEHGDANHGFTLYQNTLHVPALIHAPGVVAGPRHVAGPRQQIDMLPTLIDMLGLQLTDAPLPGRSLLSEPDPGRTLYFTSMLEQVSLAMRQGDRKLVYHFGRQPMEAYDLRLDPDERTNIAERLTESERLQAEERMWTWFSQVGQNFR